MLEKQEIITDKKAEGWGAWAEVDGSMYQGVGDTEELAIEDLEIIMNEITSITAEEKDIPILGERLLGCACYLINDLGDAVEESNLDDIRKITEKLENLYSEIIILNLDWETEKLYRLADKMDIGKEPVWGAIIRNIVEKT